MSNLTRREFFSILTLKSIKTIKTVLAPPTIAPPLSVAVTLPRVASCARCYAPFDPNGDELLCADCRVTQAKQQSLMSELLPKEKDLEGFAGTL